MSIIYDALKKAENTIHKSFKIGVSAKPQNSKSKIKVIALYALIICFGLIIANIVFGFLNHPLPTVPLKEKAKVDNKVEVVSKPKEITPKEPIQSQPIIKNEPEKSYVLNGIFFSQDEGYALINNQIVKTGDKVDGAIVLRISADEVELNSSGTTIKLTRSK